MEKLAFIPKNNLKFFQPRANEAGGLYGKGVIARKYEKNTVMKVRVELTANHMGYFEFRLQITLIGFVFC